MKSSKEVILSTAKVGFISVLFLIFLKFFAIAQIQAYMNEGVFVEVSYSTDVPSPDFTVCPLNDSTESGWKDFGWKVLQNCDRVKNSIECLLNFTFIAEDYTARLSHFANTTEEITAFQYGNCLSFKVDSKLKLESRMGSGKIRIPLKKSLAYSIFIYDPKFFFISTNPKAHPGLKIDLDFELLQKNDKIYSKIELVQHEKLNQVSQPCIEEETYNFGECLRLHLESKANCRLPWHEQIYGKNERKTCKTLDEFKTITKQGFGIFGYMVDELKEVMKDSGCGTPCKYTEVRAVGPPTTCTNTKCFRKGPDNFFLFSPILVSTNIRKETERLSVPFSTLVANLGGLLGMFLGFSFMIFWDWFVFAFNFITARRQKTCCCINFMFVLK